jgi:prepilin-type N-terminal cleavage/methylation domain-containing protein
MKKQAGFTLIELLVVIAIVGVLSVVAVVTLNSAFSKARDARRISDITQIQTVLDLYYDNRGVYPAQAGVPLVLGKTGALTFSSGSGWSDSASGTLYMAAVPADPQSGYNYSYQVNNTNLTTYEIRFRLENENAAWGTGVYCKALPGIVGCGASF